MEEDLSSPFISGYLDIFKVREIFNRLHQILAGLIVWKEDFRFPRYSHFPRKGEFFSCFFRNKIEENI